MTQIILWHSGLATPKTDDESVNQILIKFYLEP